MKETLTITKPSNTKPSNPDKWTQFWDMHSGGGTKIKPYNSIYIEAPEEEAINLFRQKFNRNPHNITCDCCGRDYSISSEPTLEQLTGFHRNCRHNGKQYVEEPDTRYDSNRKVIPLDEYLNRPDVLVIYVNREEA